MENIKIEQILAILNFMILLIQVIIRSEIKRLEEKVEYIEKRLNKLENKTLYHKDVN
jgi:polyhydroxyalkanoate synthesis regulator phasin